jgi:TrmH family RNA methyltransferase
MATITSQQNDRVKLVRALQSQPKTRRTEEKIVLEGARLINDALDSGAIPNFIFHTADAIQPEHASAAALYTQLQGLGVDVFDVAPEIMTYVSDTQSPQGILAVFPMPKLELPAMINLALILDGIADPGNLGTILRSAAAAGADLVILAPASVDPFNPKVIRGAMGAHFRLPIRRLTWSEIREYYGAKTPIYVADASGDMHYTAVDWHAPAAVLIGGEAHGPEEDARALAKAQIRIPMASGAESLNAAMAASIILFEARRQRTEAQAGQA